MNRLVIRTIARAINQAAAVCPKDKLETAADLIIKKILQLGLATRLENIAEELEADELSNRNEVRSEAVFAHKLSEATQELIVKKISDRIGKKVLLNSRIDPQVVGGVRVESDNWMFRATVQDLLSKL